MSIALTEFQRAMSSFAAGVNAITTINGDEPQGILATSVCSLSADPPTVLVCVNKSASIHDSIVNQQRFAVNLLSLSHTHVAQRFQKEKGQNRFSDDEWVTLVTGAPVLRNATVALDCKLDAAHDGHSHSIFIGLIEAVQFDDPTRQDCLLWHGRSYAQSVPV